MYLPQFYCCPCLKGKPHSWSPLLPKDHSQVSAWCPCTGSIHFSGIHFKGTSQLSPMSLRRGSIQYRGTSPVSPLWLGMRRLSRKCTLQMYLLTRHFTDAWEAFTNKALQGCDPGVPAQAVFTLEALHRLGQHWAERRDFCVTWDLWNLNRN